MEPGLWPEALESMVGFVGNSGTHLWLMDESSKQVSQTVHVGMPDRLMADYNGERVKACPRVNNALRRPMYELLYDYQYMGESEINHNEYYDWLQKTGDGIRYHLAVRFPSEEGLTGYQSLAFRAGEGHSTEEHRRRFEILLPHVQRSVRLCQQIGGWQSIAGSSMDLLEQLRYAAALLDSTGAILASNSAFERLLAKSDWIRARQRKPVFVKPALQRLFEDLVQRSVETSLGKGRRPGGTLRVQRSGTEYTLTVSPLRDVAGALSVRQARVALLIKEPETNPEDATQRLREHFQLSRAQARVAAELVSGSTLKEASEKLNVSVSTTRSHLKALFVKTGTHRQADLVRTLLPATLIKTNR
jgi:DNA-binding CsgD family transcriptional regulator